ncbi:hypothetical protein GJA_4490 [Janthinobacterium agaricidamnosum NBRC 102515 = DSM 9628]|uniref:Uncharacterized protein n=1 Tax=Janthinobacterium agaricidamnosum NBRC 102515 = DSM 9628 TaxID=1349767 RepID=W0VCR6_9BURK|nr:hypothetical protein GJA_4490 [Janthinobacterium agaricidamnosum NBRC 102515 = DSM 9628]
MGPFFNTGSHRLELDEMWLGQYSAASGALRTDLVQDVRRSDKTSAKRAATNVSLFP